jgi:hypothetical protein
VVTSDRGLLNYDPTQFCRQILPGTSEEQNAATAQELAWLYSKAARKSLRSNARSIKIELNQCKWKQWLGNSP